MSKKFVVQHLGYPVSRAIDESEWKTYSKHETESAAHKAISKAREPWGPHAHADHFRVVRPDGTISDHQEWLDGAEFRRLDRVYGK